MQAGSKNGSGFTLIEMMIVVAIIGLLAAIAIPNLVHARITAQTNACINNLNKIDGAKQQWAMEHTVPLTARPGVAELQPYLGRGSDGSLPTCPLDTQNSWSTSYRAGNLLTLPTCRIAPETHFLSAPASQNPAGNGSSGGGGG